MNFVNKHVRRKVLASTDSTLGDSIVHATRRLRMLRLLRVARQAKIVPATDLNRVPARRKYNRTGSLQQTSSRSVDNTDPGMPSTQSSPSPIASHCDGPTGPNSGLRTSLCSHHRSCCDAPTKSSAVHDVSDTMCTRSTGST